MMTAFFHTRLSSCVFFLFQFRIYIIQMHGIHHSTDKEVWRNIISFRQVIIIILSTYFFIRRSHVHIHLNDILGIGELLIDSVLAKVASFLIILTITDIIYIILTNQRTIMIDMVNNLSVWLVFQLFVLLFRVITN